MAGSTVKKTEKYGLSIIPKESGDVKFLVFRDLLMGDEDSNMQKIDAALALKGASLYRNEDSGTIELKDEKGNVLSSITSNDNGDAFISARVKDGSGGWKYVLGSDTDGVLSITPGDNISLSVSEDEIKVSAKVPTVDAALSSSSENPVRNSAVSAALSEKLGKNENAVSATKASQDESGNNIKANYGAGLSLSSNGRSFSLLNKNGSAIGTVDLPEATFDEVKDYIGIE